MFVSIKKDHPGQAYKVMNALWGQGQMMFAKILVIVDADVDVQDPQRAWWEALNHIDPQRDILFSKGPADVLDHAAQLPCLHSKMGIDGTKKLPGEGFERPGRSASRWTPRWSGRPWPGSRPGAWSPRRSRRHGPESGGRLKDFGDLVKFSHTIFLFPFALSALLLATREHPLTVGIFFWVVVALVAARSAAMIMNRIADRRYDALNPRTAMRPWSPAG